MEQETRTLIFTLSVKFQPFVLMSTVGPFLPFRDYLKRIEPPTYTWTVAPLPLPETVLISHKQVELVWAATRGLPGYYDGADGILIDLWTNVEGKQRKQSRLHFRAGNVRATYVLDPGLSGDVMRGTLESSEVDIRELVRI